MFENVMDKYSYYGYFIMDYYKIDFRFGFNVDFIVLSIEVKLKGFGIIMDMVFNYIGSNYLWMKDMFLYDWINNNGKFVGIIYKCEVFYDFYVIVSDIMGFSDGWFVLIMLDLN